MSDNDQATAPVCPRRRRLLAALGLGGVVAYAAPTLFSLGQVQADDWEQGRWRIIYDSHPDGGGRRYVDDYREYRRHRDRHHHRHRHHHKRRHWKHSRPSYSRPSFSHPSRW